LHLSATEEEEIRDPNGGTLPPSMATHRFCRIPLNKPESLFFTAFKNVPKPLPEFAVKLAMQRRDLPLNIYN
jgi:hypothetical protein